MGLTKQHIQAAQGALFLIDHIGKAPLGTPFRQYTDQAIAEHLKKHTYYYQQNNLPGPSNRKPVTLQWMRKYLLGLLAKVNNSFYQPRLHRDDAADTLFRKGTTEGFSHALLTKYGYNKANFSESDLPGYAEVESEAGNDEDADGEIETLDGEEGQRNENEADAGTARRQVQATQVEVAAPFFPPPSNGHNPSFTSAKDDNDELSSEDSEDLGDDDGNDRYFDGNEYLDAFNPNKSGLQVVIETTAPSPAKATPVSLKKVKSEIEDTEPAIARTEPPKKRGRPRKQAAIPATQPARSSFPSAAEGSSISQLSSDTTFVHAAQEQAVSENASFPLPGKPNSMSQPLRNIADSKEAIQEQVRTWVGSAKRKRESVDFDSMINSSEDDSATRSAKRKNSKLANKVGPEPAHHGTVVPNATLPFKPTFATSVPTSTDATLREGLPKDTRPAAKEVRDPQSFQTSVPSQVPETKHQPAPFRTDEQARNFENFYQMIQVATDQVIASIGDLGSSLSFLDPIPSNRLESLYVRCWGPHWEAVRLKLTKDYVFTVPEVTMSLISAFLYNNVCNQHASAQDIQAKQLELRGTTGRAILRILDLNNDGKYVLRNYSHKHD